MDTTMVRPDGLTDQEAERLCVLLHKSAEGSTPRLLRNAFQQVYKYKLPVDESCIHWKEGEATINNAEKVVAMNLLGRLTFPVRPEIFGAWCAAFPTFPVEWVVVRQLSSGWEVLTFRRPPKEPTSPGAPYDPVFGGLLHSIGGLQLPHQKNANEVIEQLKTKKHPGLDKVEIVKNFFAGVVVAIKGPDMAFGENPRSHEVARVMVNIAKPDCETPPGGVWLPLDDLPDHTVLIGHHRYGFLPIVADALRH